jgi:predicted NBD/HSP70 family sugar kinase
MASKFTADSLKTRIVATIHGYSKISRADTARILGVSPSTVSRIVDLLINSGIVFEEGSSPNKRSGRPSTLLQLNPDIATILAVDLRLTEAYAVLSNLNGDVLASDTESLDVENVDHSKGQLLALLSRLVKEAQDKPSLRMIVIGAPSIVCPSTGIIEWAPSLGWKNLPLGQIVENELNLPTRIENDVNLAALGELWKGAAQHAHNMVFVSVGTGIGAGIILNRDLYYGSTNAAGEVGYFITDIETLQHEAGRIGNLEMRAGREGIIRRAYLVAQHYPLSDLAELINRKNPEVRAQDIFKLAQEGDPAALVVFNETVDLLTIVICNLSVVLDPEIIVLGGPSDWKWEMFVEAIQKRIGSSLLHPVNLHPSRLGRDTVINGAVYAAVRLEDVLSE